MGYARVPRGHEGLAERRELGISRRYQASSGKKIHERRRIFTDTERVCLVSDVNPLIWCDSDWVPAVVYGNDQPVIDAAPLVPTKQLCYFGCCCSTFNRA